MKKILLSLIAVCLLCAVTVVCGCDKNLSEAKLVYGKKYISGSYARDENHTEYFIFNEDGTGTYAEGYNYMYVIKFDYTRSGDTVICTYNSEIENKLPDYHCDSNWYASLKLSENFLTKNSLYYDAVYFCEDYLETIPEFGK